MIHPVVQYDPRDQVTLDLSTAATFVVDCSAGDMLVLQVNLTRAALTALVFTFENAGIHDPSNYYQKAGVDYGTGVITKNKPFTLTTSATGKHEIPFWLTGVGVTSGRVRVTVTPTAGGGGDSAIVTPVVVKVT